MGDLAQRRAELFPKVARIDLNRTEVVLQIDIRNQQYQAIR